MEKAWMAQAAARGRARRKSEHDRAWRMDRRFQEPEQWTLKFLFAGAVALTGVWWLMWKALEFLTFWLAGLLP